MIRAHINVAQSRIELAAVERQVVLDVRQAHLEFNHSLAVQRRLKDDVLPAAQSAYDVTFKQFKDGEGDMRAYLSAYSDFQGVVREYIKAAIRHRRGALALNTAVGKRLLP